MSSNYIQLLPTPDQARLIRRALNAFVTNGVTQDEEDMAWDIIAEISRKLVNRA